MALLLHAYDQTGPAQLIANAAAQGAARQQQTMEILSKIALETAHNRQLSIENQRRLDFEKSKEAERAREFDVEQAPYAPPSIPSPTAPRSPTAGYDAGSPGLDVSDAPTGELSGAGAPGVNLYNVGGPQPLSAPLIPSSDTAGFMPGNDAAEAPADMAPAPSMQLQPPNLEAASAEQTGGMGSAFGKVDPFQPPQFDAPSAGPAPDASLQTAAGRAATRGMPLEPPALPSRDAIETAKEETALFAQNLAGIPKKYAIPAITHFATARATAAARSDDNTLPDGSRVMGGKQYRADDQGKWSAVNPGDAGVAELTKDMAFDPATNTYQNKDGAKFFVGQSRGKVTLTPWKPETVKAKRTFLGSDGKPYSIGQDGVPLQPVPEGVQLVEGKLPSARTLPDGSLGIVNPDNSVTTLIPATIKLGDKAKADYLKAMNDAHVALTDLNATELQYQNKPSVAKDWYGITDKTVKEKRDSFDAAQQKVLDMQTLYPALKIANPTGTAPAAPNTPARPAAPTAPVTRQALNKKTGQVQTLVLVNGAWQQQTQ